MSQDAPFPEPGRTPHTDALPQLLPLLCFCSRFLLSILMLSFSGGDLHPWHLAVLSPLSCQLCWFTHVFSVFLDVIDVMSNLTHWFSFFMKNWCTALKIGSLHHEHFFLSSVTNQECGALAAFLPKLAEPSCTSLKKATAGIVITEVGQLDQVAMKKSASNLSQMAWLGSQHCMLHDCKCIIIVVALGLHKKVAQNVPHDESQGNVVKIVCASQNSSARQANLAFQE